MNVQEKVVKMSVSADPGWSRVQGPPGPKPPTSVPEAVHPLMRRCLDGGDGEIPAVGRPWSRQQAAKAERSMMSSAQIPTHPF